MPETYAPKDRDFPLSKLNDTMRLVRVRCRYCKRLHNYAPSDLIQIFGDVDSLAFRIKCENGNDHGRLEVEAFVPTGVKRSACASTPRGNQDQPRADLT
ncbi:hypothetical protein [Mesorhizobium sp. M0488]|uniref:hypothetical protein n=1 Tax=unclassified Mesorhizobium TaxID=325217 RepID=UPI00333D905F